jgi:hypothetical protein
VLKCNYEVYKFEHFDLNRLRIRPLIAEIAYVNFRAFFYPCLHVNVTILKEINRNSPLVLLSLLLLTQLGVNN